MNFGLSNVIFILILIIAFAFVTYNAIRLISYLKVAKPENKWNFLGQRIKQTLVIAFGQSKILRDKKAGPIHAGIFWGFLILLFSVIQSILVGFGLHDPLSFLGPVWTIITLLTDIFCLLVIIAVIFALIRRYVVNVPRLPKEASEKREAAFILLMILVIVTSLLFENASHYVIDTARNEWAFRPFSRLLSLIIPVNAAPVIYGISWWVHIIFVLSFMNYLPYSKHLHVLTSVPNVFTAKLEFPAKLDKINFEEEGVEKFGVVDIDDFKWKTLLDGYTCTHCGRCTSVCPANQTGKVLDPREIIVQIRERTMEAAPIMKKINEQKAQAAQNGTEFTEPQLTEEEKAILDKKLIGDYVSEEALWQCTSCGACMQECPVMIEHVPAIVGMRRSLMMMEASFPQELQPTLSNLETNGTPWAFSQMERADWAQGTGVKTAADNPDFDILFWVGCFGSYDDRAKKISVAFTKLMQEAGINFAILGTEEICNGDPARRLGNEYLADMQIKMNVDTMSRYNVNKIVTICPHCFNTFKNEYPDFGGKYEVIHHTQFLQQLIDQGKLKLKKGSSMDKIAYHDSCYLGRYNDIYEPPRNVISSISGLNVVNPPRSHDKGFCCGAGGGRMFMEETEGKRVNIDRTEELINTGASTIAANCPFCMTMLNDGLKAKDAEEKVKVLDVAEILLEHVEINSKEKE